MDLVDRVRRTIGRHRLLGPETRVVVGLSGGSDSVALAYLLSSLDASGELRLIGLSHFNHQLRPSAADEERFCGDIAARMGLPLISGEVDVRALATREGRSLEDAARTARHAFLEQARLGLQADVIALGHTRDDQAETFLLRLLRGAGAKGLAGMHPRRGALIRPLLDCRRAELRRFLEDLHLAYVTDESNADVSIPRNRVRAELIPLLERRFNPAIVDVLAGEAETARDEYWHLVELADTWLTQFARRGPGRLSLDAAALLTAPMAVSRTVIHGAMGQVSGGRAIGLDDVERTLELAAAGPGGSFDAPGQRVQRIGAEVVLTGRPFGWSARAQGQQANLFEYPLSIPGEVVVLESGATVSAEVFRAGNDAATPGAEVATVQLPGGLAGLRVRNRRQGDRFQPFGMEGRKKLQDFFVDRKVARQRRDTIPIVVDEADRIIWVAGHAIDESFRVKDPAQTVIILRLKGGGGSD